MRKNEKPAGMARGVSGAPRLMSVAAAVLALCGAANVSAFEIDSGNDDLKIRFDNQIKLNVIARATGVDPGLGNNPAFDESSYRAPKSGDVAGERIDWMGELDLDYKGQYGARVSAAAWYDRKYDDHRVAANPGLPASASNFKNINNELSAFAQRFYNGPSGEFLDAFVWGNFQLGETDLGLKVGRHTQLWGEVVFTSANSIAFSQAPTDGLKQAVSPGATAKETAMPTNQITANWQLNDRFSLSGQYALEWRNSRMSEGGTLFGSDALLDGNQLINGAASMAREAAIEGDKGSWGLAARWRPAVEWLDSRNVMLGAYYRKFDDQTTTWSTNTYISGGPKGRAVYAKDIELFGLSSNWNVGGTAVGAEASYRKNTPLVTSGFTTAALGYEGARGNTWHLLGNTTTVFNPNGFWDTASLVVELSYQHLDKVTVNPGLFKSNLTQAACASNTIAQGCATRNSTQLAINFGPSWQQVWPSTDLSASVTYMRGLRGNAATGGVNEGFQVIVLGLTAEYKSVHRFSATYTNYDGKRNYGAGSGTSNGLAYQAFNGGASLDDRDFVSLTYQYNF